MLLVVVREISDLTVLLLYSCFYHEHRRNRIGGLPDFIDGFGENCLFPVAVLIVLTIFFLGGIRTEVFQTLHVK